MGLMSEEEARNHPKRSTLLRSLGRELIVSVDQIAMPLVRDDRLVLCSDGLHGVLRDNEIDEIANTGDAHSACQSLITTANKRGTPDNLTAAILRIMTDTGLTPTSTNNGGLLSRLSRLFTRTS
jgi:protein phosphatase